MSILQGPHHLPSSSPTALVVLLHGYGATGENLMDLADLWSSHFPQVAFYSPHAPEPCEAAPGGHQWFGLRDFSPYNIRAGLDRAGPVLHQELKILLAHHHLQPSQLVLVGFSQGTMMALEMMYFLPDLLGILGYSGLFHPSPSAPVVSSPEVCLIHGTLDTVVPYPLMIESLKQLHHLGIQTESHSCLGLGHSINTEGLQKGKQFLQTLGLADGFAGESKR